MRLAEQLRQVDLQMLVTDVDTRSVVARLRREGIDNAMQLILLTEEEVLRWYNVGPVFVEILSGMRQQVVANPERIVDIWHNQHRLLVLPDDLDIRQEEDDFFGLPMVAEDEVGLELGASASVGSDNPIALLERCLVAAIEMSEHRWERAQVLRKYYMDGLPIDTIVEACNLPSSAALFRIVGKNFREPLLRGYQVKGIQFSESLLKTVKTLKKALLYAPSTELDILTRIVPNRFLEFLGLTLLQRTTAETFWGGDYIVREGEVERCRRTQRDLFASLQFRVVAAKESTIRKSITSMKNVDKGHSSHWLDINFLRVLLHTHPCIEESKKGFRLVSERLNYDCARLARIVYDAHMPLSIDDIQAQYERRYMQRPGSVAIANVRKHFPHIHSIRRGVWEWK